MVLLLERGYRRNTKSSTNRVGETSAGAFKWILDGAALRLVAVNSVRGRGAVHERRNDREEEEEEKRANTVFFLQCLLLTYLLSSFNAY